MAGEAEGPWNDFAPQAAGAVQAPQSGPWDDFAAPGASGATPAPIDGPTREAAAPKISAILGSFTSEFKEGWGPESMGISEENTKKLQDLGFFRTMKDDRWNVGKAAWEMLLDGGVRSAETLIRGGTGLFRGAQGAVFEALGRGSFARDIAAFPEAFLGTPHPAGVPKSFVKPTPIEPILHGEAPAPPSVRPRAELARTGDPIVDGILDHPTMREVINNGVVDRSHEVPNSWGASMPIDNPTTYIDHEFPKTLTVDGKTIDVAEPALARENAEAFAVERLMKAGLSRDEAMSFSFWEVGNRVEDAWYEANGMDPARVEEALKPYVDKTANRSANPDRLPPDLFRETYPDGDPLKDSAGTYPEPSPELIQRGREILQKDLVPQEADYIQRIASGDAEIPSTSDLSEHIKRAEEAEQSSSGMDEKTYKRLQRLNRMIDEGSDEAIVEKNKLLENLPPEAEGPDLPDVESLKQLRLEFDSLERRPFETEKEYADGVARVLKRYVAKLTDGDDFARAIFRKAFAEAQAHGLDTKALSNDLLNRFINDLSSESDREFMRKEFKQFLSPKLPAPDLAAARDLGVIGPEEPPKIESVKDVDRVMAARRTGDEKITQEAGAKDPWEERWKKFTSKIDKPLDVQRIIRDPALTDPDKFMAARRGDISRADLNELARVAGVDAALVDDTVVGAAMKNDEQVRLGMKILMQTAEDVKSAAQEHASSPSDTSRIKLQETIMRRDIALEQILGFRGEWGRTGNVFQEFLKTVKDQEQLSEFLAKKGRTAADLDEIANHINNLTPAQAARYLSTARELKPTGLLHWLWTQGLISGLFTHAKYVLANALYTTTERAVTPAIAAVVGTILRSEDRVLFGEAYMGAAGLGSSAAKGLVIGMKSWATGTRIGLRSEIEAYNIYKGRYDAAVAAGLPVPKEIVAGMKKLENAVSQIAPFQEPAIVSKGREGLRDLGERVGGSWGRVTADTFGNLATPGNMAMGIHAAFKYMGENAARESRAYRNTVAEGLKPTTKEFWDRWEYNVVNQSLEDLLGNIGDAYKGTFMQDLGEQGKIWSKWTKEQKGAKWAFPFSHIPINLAKASYEHTPLAYADGEMRAALKGEKGERERDLAIARVVLGSGVMAYMGNLALNGLSTGDYPRDAQERKRWKQNGIQPNSVQMGGWWVSLNKAGPVGTLAGAAADFAQVAHIIGSDDEDKAMKAVWQMANAGINIVKNEVGFLSVSMFLDAMNDEAKGVKWVANQAASALPFSSLLGQTAAAQDPDLREVKTFTDALKYKIPGQRETLLPQRDVFGQPRINPAFGGNPFFGALRASPVATDKVLLEMERLGLHPTAPHNSIGGVKLPPALYDKYLAMRGGIARETVESFMRQPSWGTMPDGVKSDLIKRGFEQAGEQARAIIQVERPDMITQGTQNKIDAIYGKKPAKKLPEMTAQ